LSLASAAGLDGWELDRLLFSHTKEMIAWAAPLNTMPIRLLFLSPTNVLFELAGILGCSRKPKQLSLALNF